MALTLADFEAMEEIHAPIIQRADPVKVEAIIDRMVEAQEPDNRFIKAIKSDAEVLEKARIAGERVPVSAFSANLDRELNLPSPKRKARNKTAVPAVTTAGIPPIGGALMAAPALLPALGGIVKGITGFLGTEAGKTALMAGGALLASRIKFPWQTPEGEGMIAPWSNQIALGEGIYGREGVSYSGRGATISPEGGYIWNNAARDGSTPATAEYTRLPNGTMVVQSLKTGQIRKYRIPRVYPVHSRMRLGDVAKAQRKLDTLYKQVAKRTPLKRGK